ncbi:MAG: signal peptide peptidase SppA [Sphingobacteriales bacterium]|nr:MAG: signal peptide peptidase SppA [Sphingobacteriales bacterium]
MNPLLPSYFRPLQQKLQSFLLLRQFFKTFFASLLAVVVGAVIIFGVILGGISALVTSAKKVNEQVVVKDGSMLLIDLRKAIHEQRETSSLPLLTDEDNASAGLYDINRMLVDAATDDRIPGVLIRTGNTSAGWATLQSIRNAILQFRKSGKPVYAYGEDYSQKDYFLASAADSVFLNPVGDFELKGMAAQLQFFKGTLEKVGVKPEIFYAGKFKSATEPLRETKMTDANRLQQSVLINRIWAEYLEAAASHAKTDTATVSTWTQQGAVLFGEDAQRLGLVDRLVYWDEVEAQIRKTTKQDADEKVTFTQIDDYTKSKTGGVLKDGRVAILFAEGDIVDGRSENDYQIASESIVSQIRNIRNNDRVKAVVLRVNSPGGSARASEIILRELQLLQKTKKLVVSMGDVAASGGYYISASADSIFVQPTTLTGSIGVFGMLFNASELLTQKLGVTFDVVKNAPYADFPAAGRPLNDAERLRMQRGVDTIYALFKSRVAVGRKLPEAQVDSLAQGRVWMGRDAVANGLADRIGGLPEAIQAAAKLAGLDNYSVVTYPEPVDRFQYMLRRFRNSPLTQIQQSLQAGEVRQLAAFTAKMQQLYNRNRKIQMALPFDWLVN